ncbi:MAG TPA: hypothetical protein VNS58_01880 [Puia sp.]|nr:hypothetical protein [Puia sp.]
MKKLIVLSAAALLVSGVSFAHAGGDKGKEKGKKSQTTKSCPGKECSKKKGS